MDNTFVDIVGFEGLYKVAPDGRIFSIPKIIEGANGGYREHNGILLAPDTTDFGYQRVTLFKNKKRFRFSVHRIVAAHFIPNPENKKEVNHKNFDRDDNRVENLEWVTKEENQQHAQKRPDRKKNKANLGKLNEKNARSKVIKQLSLDGNLINVWPSAREVQRQLGFLQGNISSCARNELKTAYKFKWQYL